MATVATRVATTSHLGFTLRKVTWDLYCQLRDEPANDRVRMDYLDGTLTLMSPAIRHERRSEVLGLLVRGVTNGLGLEVTSLRSTTLRREDDHPSGGVGKEPDNAFYFGENERRMRKKVDLDLDVDPPPDLAIEVDSTNDSRPSLPIYARLGIPEVWRYDVSAHNLWFGRLVGGHSETIERSVNLPRLTPALVLHALDVLDDGEMGENAWFEWLKGWARELPEVPATA